MARHLEALFAVEAVLTAIVPLHVGNADNEMGQDAPLACNGKGEPYIAGTSLAGPLRAWWHEVFGEDAAWGRVEEKNERAARGYASLISIEDAPAKLLGGAAELRDGVGIDRFTGAAAQNIKYDRQILPAGTTFDFKLRLEVPAKGVEQLPVLTSGQWQARLAAMVRALEAGEIRFGAAKTRGFGLVKASGIGFVRHELNTPAGILARLTGKSPKIDWLKAKDATADLPNRVVMQIKWRAKTPVMNNSGMIGLAIDALPLTTGRVNAKGERERIALLTGASVKGVLRGQAERIWRTMAGAFEFDASQSHLGQIALPLVESLFGGPGTAEDGKTTSRIGLGALSVDDCPFGPGLTAVQWQAMQNAGRGGTPEEQKAAVSRAQTGVVDANPWGKAGARISQHVAIDRWTGGAAKGLLFNRLEPPKAEGVFRLSLDLARLVDRDGNDVSGACIALLLFVLRDLAKARIPVGFGGNRGLGGIEITGFGVERAGARAGGRGFSGKGPGPEALTDPEGGFLQGFAEADEAWAAYWRKYKADKGGGNV